MLRGGGGADLAWLAIAWALALVAFAPGFHGDFVYDDTRQIIENPWLRSPQFLTKLLSSDVWGYRADEGAGWSDYWRPLFSGWLLLNGQMFGFEKPLGWHVLNLLLHCLVVFVCLPPL